MAEKRFFTDRYLKSIKPAPPGERPIIWDATLPGGGIRIDNKSCPEKVGAFVMVKRWPGSKNPAPRTIGFYSSLKPNEADHTAPVGARMSLARYHAIGRAWLDDLARGIDPKKKMEDERREQERRHADTFNATLEVYATERLAKKRYGKDAKSALQRYAGKEWGNRPISSIRRAEDVKSLIREIDKDAPSAAAMQLRLLKTFFKWCEREELIESSPASSVEPLSAPVERERVLDEKIEIPAFWRASGELGVFGRAFKMELVTGQRRTNVGRMRWEHIDHTARLWIIPGAEMKSGRPHSVPLSDLAIEILSECPKMGGPFVFTTNGAAPISGWSKGKAKLVELMQKHAAEVAKARGYDPPGPIPQFGLHDLRRTCGTHIPKLGFDRLIVSKVLSHSEGGATKIYDRHSYDDQKRMALDAWARRLREIIEGSDGGNVVTFVGRAER